MSVDEDHLVSEEHYEVVHDDKSHQGCYIYAPRTEYDEGNQRPSKRQKAVHSNEDCEVALDIFPPLLDGHEVAQHTKYRQTAFRKCWKEQNSLIEGLLEPADSVLLEEVVQFVKNTPIQNHQDRLRTGLVAFGPNTRLQTRLLEQWRSTQSQKKTAIVVGVDSTQTPNLMTALKNVIRAAIIQLDGMEGYQTFLDAHKRKIQMNYDLELLHVFVAARNVQKCVIYLTDIETFDIGLLTDLLSVLNEWRDRIPFVLLLGISTTVDLFEARVPKSAIQLLDCILFSGSRESDPCLQIYQSFSGQSNRLAPLLGPAVSSALAEMSREQDASAASYSRAIKYATMSYFFANALSVFLGPDTDDQKPNREVCEAIRSTNSVRTFVEAKLNEGNAEAVRGLLGDDKILFQTARKAIKAGQDAMSRHQAAATLFGAVLKSIAPLGAPLDSFSIQVQALSGPSFLDSTTYTELISNITTLPSDRMRGLLDAVQQHTILHNFDLDGLLRQLDQVAPPTMKVPLRSAYDPSHTTATTTITNNKVSLSKHGPKLSAKETEYTRLVDEVVDALSSYFETNICNPTTLFLHEAFVYDLKSPLAAVFNPRPRYATERALSSPYDYLGCECCEGQASGQLSASQPPTSVLWQLWCEAGGIVNVRDLWNAFSAIILDREEDGDDAQAEGDRGADQVSGKMDERMALALFYKGLAELKMMGFVKGTKRKADCLAKTAWKGL